MEPIQTNCPQCGTAATGNHCAACGAKVHPARITLHSIVHEAFHYFTHLDKGFGYTLKELFRHPGTMQLEYVNGRRALHQKPFSMFFLCGTICGLSYYFINQGYDRLYGADNHVESDFFRHYFVLLQAVLMPLYALLAWVAFRKTGRNYAEILVLTMYLLSATFLMLVIFQLLRLIFPHYDNRILELIFLLIYNPLTNLRFFGGNKWVSILKSAVVIVGCYLISQVVSGAFRGLMH
ncbi:MAG: DUF3667 domain-containing protein [Sphingobacteriales bacterium]|nr:MAG: DUF3667 domain-containing protein [Sphingobacteriales bacterium]